MDNLQKLIQMLDSDIRHLKMFAILSDDMHKIETRRSVSLAPVAPTNNKES